MILRVFYSYEYTEGGLDFALIWISLVGKVALVQGVIGCKNTSDS